MKNGSAGKDSEIKRNAIEGNGREVRETKERSGGKGRQKEEGRKERRK
jgi:hypothetical protein